MNRVGTTLAVLVLVMALVACAASSPEEIAVSTPAAGSGAIAGMCAEGATDCVDTPQLLSDEPVAIDETGIRQFRKDAKYYLGRDQDELTELIRIARIDDEQFALTDDYQVGRITVELDDVKGNGKPIVTSSTIELPDGPETFELEE